MQIGLESDPWGARSGAAGTLRGHSPPQACRQARNALPASSAAFPQQRRVRLQSTKKKELSSIKKDPFRGLLLCSRCLPLHDLRAEHYALVYSVSSQYVQDRLCRRHALVIQHISHSILFHSGKYAFCKNLFSLPLPGFPKKRINLCFFYLSHLLFSAECCFEKTSPHRLPLA